MQRDNRDKYKLTSLLVLGKCACKNLPKVNSANKNKETPFRSKILIKLKVLCFIIFNEKLI